MKVKLINSTPNAAAVCALAAFNCQQRDLQDIEDLTDQEISRVLNYCYVKKHMSVFEHANYTFHISKISRACSAQLLRHRLMSVTERSQRACKPEAFIIPDSIADKPELLTACADLLERVEHAYDTLVAHGIPKEDARFMLPMNSVTSLVVTINARELYHIIALRTCTKAQWEVRKVADTMCRLLKAKDPILFKHLGRSCQQLGYCPEGNEKLCQ